MAHHKYIAEYNNFMFWFKLHFPWLYGKYWTSIVMPLDGSGIGVHDLRADDETYEKLVDIVFAYYHK